MTNEPICIYGRGKLGETLFARAEEAGIPARLLQGRGDEGEAPSASLIVLAIPDGAVSERMHALDARFSASIPFVHVAGTLPSRFELPSGRPTGGMHPLISFASRDHQPRIRGRTFTLRGDQEAIDRARALVLALGGVPLVRELSGPAYHAAAAALANGGVALAELAASILDSLGIEERERNLALAGLLESVADNLRELGPIGALTGPIARGDSQTVEGHRRALSPEARRDYDAIARIILGTAGRAGLDEEARAQILRAIDRDDLDG